MGILDVLLAKDTIVTAPKIKGENPAEMSLRLFDQEQEAATFKADTRGEPSFQPQMDKTDPAFFAEDQVSPPITGAPERRAEPSAAPTAFTPKGFVGTPTSDRTVGNDLAVTRLNELSTTPVNKQKLTDVSDTRWFQEFSRVSSEALSTGANAALLATVDHESNGGSTLVESGNYTRASAIAKLGGDPERRTAIGALYDGPQGTTVEGQRRLTKAGQEELFNIAYGTLHDGGLGNTEVGDGFKFRGRGLIQVTGRNNYASLSTALGLGDLLVREPDLLSTDPAIISAATLQYVEDKDLEGNLSAKGLARVIGHANRRNQQGVFPAETRWAAVVAELRTSGQTREADEMELRDEYAAQRAVGTTVDGSIGPNSKTAMRSWLTGNTNLTTVEASALTSEELVVAVNSAP